MKLFGLLAGMLLSFAVMASEAVWIDVRTPAEFGSGHVDGAINIPHTRIAKDIAALELAKDSEILLYCRSGRRASFALEQLQQQGYTRVVNVGGYDDAQNYQQAQKP